MVGLDVSSSSKYSQERMEKRGFGGRICGFCLLGQGLFRCGQFGYEFWVFAFGEDDLKSLKDVRSVLGINGVLVVDVFNSEHLIKKGKSKSKPKWREYPSFFLLQERSVAVDGGELHDKWVIRDKSDGQIRVFQHVARLYTRDQLRGLLEKAGFDVYAVLGDYERQEFSFDSNRLIMVSQCK